MAEGSRRTKRKRKRKRLLEYDEYDLKSRSVKEGYIYMSTNNIHFGVIPSFTSVVTIT
jgi:hypothetical protein